MADNMGVQAIERAVRKECFDQIIPILAEYYGADPDHVFVSNTEIVFPALTPNRDETWVKIAVSVPRGAKYVDDDGYTRYEDYDGDTAISDYEYSIAEKAAKKAANEKKRNAPKEKARKRKEAKETIKTMADDIRDVLPTVAKGE